MRSSDGSVHYVYHPDLLDHVLRVDDLVHHIMSRRVFDQNGRMIEEILANGLRYGYTYDALGRLRELTLPDRTAVSYQYDAVYLRSVTRNKNGSYSQHYQYDLSGKVVSIVMPNGLGNVAYTYDTCLRPKEITSPFWSQQIPEGGYDPCGNVMRIDQKDIAGSVTSQFTYDALYHLVSETGCAQHVYAFDSAENRISKNNVTYHVNALNQLKHQSGSDYHYDPNGNLSAKWKSTGEISYRYDALDRLISIQTPERRIEYQYDGFHRRIKKTLYHVENGGWKIHGIAHYGYQGDFEVGSYDTAGNQIELRIIGDGAGGDIGATVLLELEGQMFVPLHDYRGNITALLDVNNRNMRETYRFSAYGEEQLFDGSGNLQQQSINPWRFSSKRMDPETGWLYFGRRYYDPEVGRWTTPDPLGFVDGHNLYCYVHNRPLVSVDSEGEWTEYLFGVRGFTQELPDPNCYGSYESWANYYRSIVKENYSRAYTIEGKKSDKFRLSFMNGMDNLFEDFMKSAKLVSKLSGGCEVKGVYNATFGKVRDGISAGLGLYFGKKTEPARIQYEEWKAHFRHSRAFVIHTCHSKGAIDTKLALDKLDYKDRMRVLILAVAPAEHIPEDLCLFIVNLESSDFVPYVDTLKACRLSTGRTLHLDRHPDEPLFDHSFDSQTYRPEIEEYLDLFKRLAEANYKGN